MSPTLAPNLPERLQMPVRDAIRKADVLIEALSYIREFRHRVVVIKIGGSVVEHEESLDAMLQDVVFMETVGLQPILVHGGGKAISAAMTAAGLEPRFVDGRRYTDEATIGIVEDVLTAGVNRSIAQRIERFGGWGIGLHRRTTCVMTATRLTASDDGAPLDLGLVGRVTGLDVNRLRKVCQAGIIPILPSIALDEADAGRVLNVNADTAAAAVARLLGADKLIFVSDTPGILEDTGDEDSLLRSLTAAQCRGLMASGTITAGMIPKVAACLESLEAGVRKIHLVDGRVRHSLLLEIFTELGVGTEIVHA